MHQWIVLAIALFGFAAQAPTEIAYDGDPNYLKLPDNLYLGEVAGVAVNSQGHIFVFSRGGTVGRPFGAAASQLLEFDKTCVFVGTRVVRRGTFELACAEADAAVK